VRRERRRARIGGHEGHDNGQGELMVRMRNYLTAFSVPSESELESLMFPGPILVADEIE
jgi:hypothetical protein